MPRFVGPALACAAMLLAGCGGSGGGTVAADESVLLLDSRPGPVHAGVYVADSRGFDDAEGAPLGVRALEPSDDPVELLRTGRVRLAILDVHDLAAARRGGEDLVGVMALVQRPLAAVLAGRAVRRPRDLERRRVAVSGSRVDQAVLRSVVAGDGGDPARVRVVEALRPTRSLLAGQVDGATAAWHDEGVAVRARRSGARAFRLDDFGAPSFPGLVLVVTRATLEDSRDDVEAVVRTLQRGYEEVAIDPESAVQAMLTAEPDLDAGELADGLDAVAPAFEAGTTDVGRLERRRLDAWADWAVKWGALTRRPDVASAFDVTIAGMSGRD